MSPAYKDLTPLSVERHGEKVSLKPFAPALTPRRLLGRLLRQGWLPGVICLALDVAAWLFLYGSAVRLRGDAAYGDELPFLQVDFIGLAVV